MRIAAVYFHGFWTIASPNTRFTIPFGAPQVSSALSKPHIATSTLALMALLSLTWFPLQVSCHFTLPVWSPLQGNGDGENEPVRYP